MMDEAQAIRQQAYERFAQGEFAQALMLFQKLESAGEGDAELANDIAVVMHRMGNTEAAVEKFREALDLGGGDFLAPNAIAVLAEQVAALNSKPAPIPAAPKAATELESLGAHLVDQALRVWRRDSPVALHKALAELDDEAWFRVLFNSVEKPLFKGHHLPGFIDAALQAAFVGSSGIAALQEAANFMRVVLKYSRANGIAFDGSTRIADFGSGWGRYTRFLLKYASPDNIFGLEINPLMVEHCRKAFGTANFLKVDAFPPCDLRNGLLDLTFGYSVFSHLAPDCANAWIDEFARITKPGGLVMMTTQGRTFIDFCANIRKRNDLSNPWFESLAKSFVDEQSALDDYDRGEFLHAGFGQYGGTYGESLIPRGYIEKSWTRYFDLVDFVDSRSFLPQALFVLKRNRTGYGS